MNGWQSGIAVAALCSLAATWPDTSLAQLSKERVPGGVEARPATPGAAPMVTPPAPAAPSTAIQPARPIAPPAAAPAAATPPKKKPDEPKAPAKNGAKEGAAPKAGSTAPADSSGPRPRGVKSGGDERKPGGVERGPNPQQ